MYWSINGESYRVADHAKPDASSGYVVGVNDFRSVDELYSKVSSIIDLSDKTMVEQQYRKDAVAHVEQITWHGELCYRNPLGGIYGTIDNAITNMWRCGYKLILQIIDMTKEKLYRVDIAGSIRQLSRGESVEFTLHEVKASTVRNIASRIGEYTVNEIGIVIKVTKK